MALGVLRPISLTVWLALTSSLVFAQQSTSDDKEPTANAAEIQQLELAPPQDPEADLEEAKNPFADLKKVPEVLPAQETSVEPEVSQEPVVEPRQIPEILPPPDLTPSAVEQKQQEQEQALESELEPESEQAPELEVLDDDLKVIGPPKPPAKPSADEQSEPIVIAHRGAPAYVPEHTAEGVAMAHALGADFIEQDVVLTRDSVPVVLHDIRLDSISNVADIFPGRTRPDGHFYVMDFSLDELRKLSIHERVVFKQPQPTDGEAAQQDVTSDAESETQTDASEAEQSSVAHEAQAERDETSTEDSEAQPEQPQIRQHANHDKVAEQKYPGRFPTQTHGFKVMTLAEQIKLIHGLNHSTGRTAGLYIEAKASHWHQQQGYDLLAQIMNVLARHGYSEPGQEPPTKLYLQSFNPEDLRNWHRDYHSPATLVQLIGENSWNESGADYDSMRTLAGLEAIANQSHAIGVWLPHVLEGVNEAGEPQFTKLVRNAHKAGLKVHVYTLRHDDLPEGVPDYSTLVDWLTQAGVDGYFTDSLLGSLPRSLPSSLPGK